MFVLKLALRPWRKAMTSQLLAVISVGFLLFLMGLLYSFHNELSATTHRLQNEQVLTLYLQPQFPEKDKEVLLGKIKELTEQAGVSKAEVEFVGMKEFISRVSEKYPTLGKELVNLGSDMDDVVPSYVTVGGLFPDTLSAQLGTIAGVESVESSAHRFKNLVTALQTFQWVIRIVLGGLIFALLTGLVQLARMNAVLHSDVTSVLKFWGASGVMLRLPGLLATLSVAVGGGFLAHFAWAFLGWGIHRQIEDLFPILGAMTAYSSPAFILLLVGVAVGTVAGILGSATGLSLSRR